MRGIQLAPQEEVKEKRTKELISDDESSSISLKSFTKRGLTKPFKNVSDPLSKVFDPDSSSEEF